jgi:hypothetical protein
MRAFVWLVLLMAHATNIASGNRGFCDLFSLQIEAALFPCQESKNLLLLFYPSM